MSIGNKLAAAALLLFSSQQALAAEQSFKQGACVIVSPSIDPRFPIRHVEKPTQGTVLSFHSVETAFGSFDTYLILLKDAQRNDVRVNKFYLRRCEI